MDSGVIDVQAMVVTTASGMTDLVATGITIGIQMKPVEAEVMDLADSEQAACEQP